jgi:hypothetical protein
MGVDYRAITCIGAKVPWDSLFTSERSHSPTCDHTVDISHPYCPECGSKATHIRKNRRSFFTENDEYQDQIEVNGHVYPAVCNHNDSDVIISVFSQQTNYKESAVDTPYQSFLRQISQLEFDLKSIGLWNKDSQVSIWTIQDAG